MFILQYASLDLETKKHSTVEKESLKVYKKTIFPQISNQTK